MALTPEQKMQALAELQRRPDTTPEQKKRIGQLWVKNLEKTEKGVQDVSVTEALDAPFKAAQAVGELGSQAAAERGMNPELAAGLGTGVAMIPHAALAAKVPVRALGKVVEGGLSTIGNKIGRIVETLKGPSMEEAKATGQAAEMAFQPQATQKASRYGRRIVEPVQQEMAALEQELAGLGGSAADKIKALRQVLKEKRAGLIQPQEELMSAKAELQQLVPQQIQATEAIEQQLKSTGAKIESTRNDLGVKQVLGELKDPRNVSKFADRMKSIGQMSSAKIREALDIENIMRIRDTAQKAAKNADSTQAAFIQRGVERLTEALPENLRGGYKQYGQLKKQLDNLPDQFKEKRAAIQSTMSTIQKRFNQAKREADEVIQQIKDIPVESSKHRSMLTSQFKAAKGKLGDYQRHVKELIEEAKNADGAELMRIRKESADLLRQGVEHDRLVRRIKQTAYSVAGIGGAAFGVKKAL